MKNWAVYSTDGIRFFATKIEAEAHAESEISVSREASHVGRVWDGWNEEDVEQIVIMEIVQRATKIPGQHYTQDDWRMRYVDCDICEHGVADGDFCEPCNRAYKEAAADPENAC